MKTLIISKSTENLNSLKSVAVIYWTVKIVIDDKEELITKNEYDEQLDHLFYKEDFQQLFYLIDTGQCLGDFFQEKFKGYQIVICENGYIDEWKNEKRRV